MDQSMPEKIIRQGDWFVLPAPSWDSAAPPSTIPPESIVGGWPMQADGRIGPFQPNPGYLPADNSTPSDPIDAILRLVSAGESDLGDELVTMLGHSVIEIGCDENYSPQIGASPNSPQCIVAATAEVQKRLVDVAHWVPVLGHQLPQIVPPGVDIVLNPTGTAPFRLLITAMEEASTELRAEAEGRFERPGAAGPKYSE